MLSHKQNITKGVFMGKALLKSKYVVTEKGEHIALGFHATKGYDEWCSISENELAAQLSALQANKEREEILDKIEDGSLITVFNTISKGDIFWQGTVDLEYKNRHRPFPMNPQYGQQEIFGMWVRGLQANLDPETWAAMFFLDLPATLERDGKLYHGSLDPFFETGTEGVIWSLSEYAEKCGYDTLHCLQNGDRLTVYSSVSDGDIDLKTRLTFKDAAEDKRQKREPNEIPFEKWQQLFYQNRPVLIQKPK